ncbi:hypothetical protein PP459_gp142 [Streptomyces phage Wakanda]|uniref:Uncharacterized protein n=2 Tax=Wakandavirus TaxID=3044854 RepID=A0A6G8R3A8_9CAUD|nr:hypothetical protein PP459_gp142 [Streptomyces phage Wakanda]YP_010652412.1 hypothetical protein PP460_gp146 [Streptomyces phage Muntaha]QIN94091.1 hypothetical protein SEA_WAKANDA_113 [Streptomyces phage Wakanda]QIN94656.1 hypothetical protein SEA_MUNTAHA_115 [Streptomyces phage Muntaha]
MPKVQDAMSMHEKTVQKLAVDELEIPRARRRKREREHPVDVAVKSKRKSVKAADKLFRNVRDDVYEKAMELADQNWRRLVVVDNETLIVSNKEVH